MALPELPINVDVDVIQSDGDSAAYSQARWGSSRSIDRINRQPIHGTVPTEGNIRYKEIP